MILALMKRGGVILDWWNGVGWFLTDEKGWGDFRLIKMGKSGERGVILDWWKRKGVGCFLDGKGWGDFDENLGYKMVIDKDNKW